MIARGGTRLTLRALIALIIMAGATTVRAEPATLDLARYRGKVVLVDFWASWCGPCKQAVPFMAQLARGHRPADLVVITVNEDRQRASGEAFLRQIRARLPVIWDSAGTIGRAWTVNEMPTALLFDRAGKVRFRHQGFNADTSPAYDAQLALLIGEH